MMHKVNKGKLPAKNRKKVEHDEEEEETKEQEKRAIQKQQV